MITGAYYTADAVALRTPLRVNTVRWHCRSGRLRDKSTRVGRVWLIERRAAEAFIVWANERWAP